MSGIQTRANIDTETVRALLLVNGGGAVALLALLPRLLDNRSYHHLVQAVLIGILLLVLGMVSAVAHNKFRRDCSLIYDQYNMRPPPGMILGIRLQSPTSCAMSSTFLWTSLVCFIVAGSSIAVVGLTTL
jgi:hypothetical protein